MGFKPSKHAKDTNNSATKAITQKRRDPKNLLENS
jgi:hypothetical protein